MYAVNSASLPFLFHKGFKVAKLKFLCIIIQNYFIKAYE